MLFAEKANLAIYDPKVAREQIYSDLGKEVIDKIEIDGVVLENVQAVVLEEGLEYSLLGMSFLNRLEGWDVTPGAIIIHQ
jgi:clan AA aspartic protease (TIGR02281 family)